MVPVLLGSTVRNLYVVKAIFYLSGNAEMSWESHIMSTEK